LIADRDAAESLAALLRYEGHEVLVANDGEAAYGLFVRSQPSVVLLDIGMPKLNGYDVARLIREREGPRPTVIAVTGWGQPHDRERSREAGFDHHLTKPVELGALQALFDVGPRAEPLESIRTAE
jgi:DNA-binding response OmpR family regulator